MTTTTLTPPGWKLVPETPTEAQLGGVARDVIMAFCAGCLTSRRLLEHLELAGHDIPGWMRDLLETQNPDDHVLSKGTRATLIYRAMVEAAPEAPEQVPKPLMDVVEHILDAGHLNTEDLARLRAAWYAAQPVDLEQAAQPDEVARLVEPQTNAARDVLAERQRQIDVEGWAPEHDDEHSGGGLAVAAACYATAYEGDPVPSLWPWEDSWWKPKDRRSNRVRACALLLAEIERLDRAALAAKGGA